MDANNTNKNIEAAIEAILFVYGEPLELKKLAKILKTGEDEVKKNLDKLNESISAENRGLKLVFQGDKVELATKPDFTPFLEDFIKEEFKEELTPASLETFSIIAYLGPIPRSRIDFYRGVNSSFILRNLLMRGLVDRSPDPERQNSFLYRISFDALKHLGISKIEDLPDYEKFKDILEIKSESNQL